MTFSLVLSRSHDAARLAKQASFLVWLVLLVLLNVAPSRPVFAQAAQTYSISGKVTENGVGLGGVTLQAWGAGHYSETKSTNPSAPIPDNVAAGMDSPITVTTTGTVISARIGVNISHQDAYDLELTLVHPDGTAIRLKNAGDQNRADLVTSYPDQSNPSGDLTLLNGKPLNGNWNLHIRDARGGNTGTLNSWTLTLVYSNPVTQTATTDANGNYTFNGLPEGKYEIRATKPQYTFEYNFTSNPPFVNVGPSATNQNFVAHGTSTISGRVTDAAGVRDVTVQAQGPGSFTLLQSAMPNARIPDNVAAGMDSPITVTTAGTVLGVRVGVNISHRDNWDLELTLVHPGGTAIRLKNVGGGGTDLVTSYPDQSNTPDALSLLNGKPLNGNWKLHIRDASGGNTGTLNSWTLTLVYSNPVTQTATTDANGNYTIRGLTDGTYVVSPIKSRYSFDPVDQRVTVRPDATGVNFSVNGAVVAQWHAVNVAVGNDNKPRLLWNHLNGTASLWTLKTDGAYESGAEYGPFSGWRATTPAVSPDGNLRLLWDHVDGRASLWLLGPEGAFDSGVGYGAYNGWYPDSISVGADSKTRLLWNNYADGRASLWTLSPIGAFETGREYGPFPGWMASTTATGPDNKTRLLWNSVDGRASVWILSPTGVLEGGREYGPFPGWTAAAISVGGDNKARLLWTNVDGRASVWILSANGALESGKEYGPFPGWSATALATGGDSRTVLLWNHTDGRASIWFLSPAAVLESGREFGPLW